MFEAYVTNLGLYPERGAGAGEYLKFPTTVEEVQALFSRIGIDGKQYEEYFITDYDSDILGLTDHLGEYKDHAETIMGNMDSIVFLGGREASTLKDISENWLGKATISMQTDSRTRGQSESYGLNTQRLGRELLTTSEITTMPGNKCLLQLRGLPPFFSPKYDLKQHPNYRYTAEHDSKRNAFHLERLTSRRLRLKPEEEYTVYEVDASDEDADILNYDDLDSADDFV